MCIYIYIYNTYASNYMYICIYIKDIERATIARVPDGESWRPFTFEVELAPLNGVYIYIYIYIYTYI